jgi:hypothetical protein
MEYVMLPHLAVTVQTILKALIAAFLFAVQLVSTEYAMLLPLLVTVKATLKALTAVDPFAVQHVSMEYVMLHSFLFAVQHVSMEYAMLLHSLVTVKATFSCDCPNNFEGPDCSIPICSPACVNGVCNAVTFTCDCQSNFSPDNHVSMEYVMLSKALTAVPPFAIHLVLMEHATRLLSPVTV